MGRNYWMKMRRDFFKRHDIKLLRAEAGNDAVLFYIQLLCESIDHDGRIRYSEKKPYTIKQLATITEMPVEIAKQSLEAAKELDLIQEEKDGTLYLPEAENMTGSETEWAEKKRKTRGQKKDNEGTPEGHDEDNVPQMSPEEEDNEGTPEGQRPTEKELELESEKEIDLEKELELEIERERAKKNARPRSIAKRFEPPTEEEVRAYCHEKGYKINPEQFMAYYQANGWRVGKNPMKDWKAAVVSWKTREEEMKPAQKEKIMENDYDFTEEGKQKKLDDGMKLLDELLKEE